MLLGMLMLLAGCGPINGASTGNQSEEVILSAKDNRGQIEVDAGQALVLTLESNPTTGFRWEVVEAEDTVLRPEGEAEFEVASALDPSPPGTGGGGDLPL
jgi:inhibitor of cysteine peptidase